MKDFLKFTFATITGIIVSVVVLVFISILVVFSMVSSSESETQVRKNSIMMLDLNGALAERSQDNPFDALMGDNYTAVRRDAGGFLLSKCKIRGRPFCRFVFCIIFVSGCDAPMPDSPVLSGREGRNRDTGTSVGNDASRKRGILPSAGSDD